MKKKIGLNDPVYSGRDFISVWEYILKHGSNIDRFFEGIPIPRNRLLNENEWFDIKVALKVWENYRRCLDDFDMTETYDIGRDMIHNSAWGITRTILQFSSIKLMIRMLPYVISTASKIDLFKCLELSRQNGLVEYSVYPGFEPFIDSSHIFMIRGTFSGLPTLHDQPPAKVRELTCLLDAEKKFTVDFAQFGYQYEDKGGSIYINGRETGRWIEIDNEQGLDPLVYKYLKGERCILWLEDIQGRKKNGSLVTIAQKGDIYNCSRALYHIQWQESPIKRRIKKSFSSFRTYSMAFFKSREDLLKQTGLLQDHARILEERVKERTLQIEEAQKKIVELEKRTLEHRITGGFAHEMRNALAGAKMQHESNTNFNGTKKSTTQILKASVSDLADTLLSAHRSSKLSTEEIKLGYSPHLKKIYQVAEHLEESMADIALDIERGLSITNQIRSYTKIFEFVPGQDKVDVVALLEGYRRMYQSEFDAFHIRYDVSSQGPCIICAEEAHLNSIFSNLVLNAKDAVGERCPEDPQILVKIETFNDIASIEIDDNGGGIAQTHLSEIYEPFFTTKPNSGTGLGLGIVKRMAELYGGWIELESKPGCGTRFKVNLPKEKS